MLRKCLSGLFLVALAWPAAAQDVSLTVKGGDIKIVKVDQITVVKADRSVVTSFPFTVVAPPDEGFYDWILPAGVVATDKGETLEVTAAPKGDIAIRVKIRSALLDNGKIRYVTRFGSVAFSVGDVGPGPKPPPDPDPTPRPPVLSFRVIFVAESGKTLTAAQNSVISGKAVRDWLTANTTPEGAFAGWRHFDPQQTVANESPNMKKLWEAVQPKLTGLPCVAIEVNGHAEIIPLAATPAEMIATFEAYRKGSK